MERRLLNSAALALLLSAACGASTPIGYTAGVRWTLPLVAPLDEAALLVPATIHGRGPLLFALDPDATASVIDRGVAEAIGLYTPTSYWERFVDGRDLGQPHRPYEVLAFQTGDLRVENVIMYSVPAGSVRVGERIVHGVIGQDLLTRTIVIDVDRDRGVVNLALTGHHVVPSGAQPVRGRVHIRPHSMPRKLVVPVHTGEGSRLDLAVDLAAHRTAVHEPLRARLGGAVASLHVDGSLAHEVAVASLADQRVSRLDYDGVLGHDVLSRYRVVFDPDRRTLWLAPRAPDPAALSRERIARWGEALDCAELGCVRLRVTGDGLYRGLEIATDAGGPAQPFQVVAQALDAHDRPLAARLFRFTATALPGSALSIALPPAYAAAAGFRVVDAAPL